MPQVIDPTIHKYLKILNSVQFFLLNILTAFRYAQYTCSIGILARSFLPCIPLVLVVWIDLLLDWAFHSKSIVLFLQAFERYVDSQPLRAIDRDAVPLLSHVLREMADFVKCEPQDIFLTENCTAGINTVIQSLSLKDDDSILTLNLGYGKCWVGT